MNKDGFPLDMLEEIIDALANLNSYRQFSATIRSFSLVCHATLPMCRKHIFASVIIYEGYQEGLRTASSLSQILTESPELGPCIRTLIFNLNPSPQTRGRAEMFEKLTRLTSLELHVRYDTYHWEDYRQNFLPLLHLPTIVRLKLSGVSNFFLSDLIRCRGLERLEIPYSTFSTRSDDIPSMIIFPNLSSMTIKVTVPDLWLFKNLLSTCHQLIDIHIDLHESPNFAGLFIMVQGSLRTLKHLRVKSEIDYRPEYLADPFSHLCQELEKMSDRNVLGCLEIGITVMTDCRYARGDEWKALEDVLMTNGLPFSALGQVSLTLTVEQEEDWPNNLLESELSRHFQKLASCPTVDFNLEVIFY